MAGEIDFTAALSSRLDTLHLKKTDVEEFSRKRPVSLTPGVERLISCLQMNNVRVYLVSGGIFELVVRVSKLLNIPEENVFVNRLIYSDDGTCIGFDTSRPTSRSDGKREVVATLKSTLPLNAGVIMVGDGMTDAMACPPADAFFGFGGNVFRPSVQQSTPYFFTLSMKCSVSFKGLV